MEHFQQNSNCVGLVLGNLPVFLATWLAQNSGCWPSTSFGGSFICQKVLLIIPWYDVGRCHIIFSTITAMQDQYWVFSQSFWLLVAQEIVHLGHQLPLQTISFVKYCFHLFHCMILDHCGTFIVEFCLCRTGTWSFSSNS